MIKPGKVVGLLDMSGRVTGPQLHFDMHLAGARVESLAWIAAS